MTSDEFNERWPDGAPAFDHPEYETFLVDATLTDLFLIRAAPRIRAVASAYDVSFTEAGLMLMYGELLRLRGSLQSVNTVAMLQKEMLEDQSVVLRRTREEMENEGEDWRGE